MVNYLTVMMCSILTISHALQTKSDDEDIMRVMQKYYDKIPQTDNKYVINEAISQIISRNFNGKISAFPLFKINIKLDRTPVKIPWTLNQAETNKIEPMKKRYRYLKRKKLTTKDR